MPRVAAIFTGGTIAMRHDPGSHGNVPAMSPAALLKSVPWIAELATVEPIDWGLVPASHLTFGQVLEIGRILREQLERPEIDGAVVVQGTDSIEETAFAWDLLPLPPGKPVVVVGAMRSASDEGYDGPENLRNAVAAAASSALSDQGVVVAMAGELHAADAVRKTHTHAYSTFASPDSGRLGTVVGGSVRVDRRRSAAHLPAIPSAAALPVHLVTAALDLAPVLVSALTHPAPAGMVVAAMGGGNTSPQLLEAARGLLAREVPVVLATRCPTGAVRPGYGFPGGSSGWWRAGALFSGQLDGLKARVLLALGIGAGMGMAELARFLEAFGGGASGNKAA